MGKLVNVADGDAWQSIHVDVDTIACVSRDVAAELVEIREQTGTVYGFHQDHWEDKAAAIVERLQAAGADLIRLAGESRGRPHQLAVAPAAVHYAIFGADGGVTLGIAGFGRLDAAMTPAETDALRARLSTRGLMAIAPGEGRSWYAATAGILVDPAAVTAMEAGPLKLDLHFRHGGWLDVTVPPADPAKISARLYSSAPNRDPAQTAARVQALAKLEERGRREALAARVTAANPALIALPEKGGATIYCERARIAFAGAAPDHSMRVGLRPGADGQPARTLWLRFRKRADMDALLARLSDAPPPPASGPRP